MKGRTQSETNMEWIYLSKR